MMAMRRREQNQAAKLGQYGVMVQLDYSEQRGEKRDGHGVEG